MSTPITFYDLRVALGVPASPNAWKARYILNIKGLPYKTTFVNFVDIKPTLQAANVPPSEGEHYTVPAIIDPATGAAVSDSVKIAVYLDTQYPDTPTVFAPETREAQTVYMKTILQPLLLTTYPVLLLNTYNSLDEKDKAYFRATREAKFGHTLEEIVPQGERRAGALALFASGLENAKNAIAKQAGEDALFFGGESPVFADIALAAAFKAVVNTSGRDGEVSKVIFSNEWAAKFFEAFEKWASEA